MLLINQHCWHWKWYCLVPPHRPHRALHWSCPLVLRSCRSSSSIFTQMNLLLLKVTSQVLCWLAAYFNYVFYAEFSVNGKKSDITSAYWSLFMSDRVSERGVCLQCIGCGRPTADHTPEGNVRGRHHWELYVVFLPLSFLVSFPFKLIQL